MNQEIIMAKLVNQLEKMFQALNAELFDNALEVPMITVIPSTQAYVHYAPVDSSWQTWREHKCAINISSGTLDRPLEVIVAFLVHEMVHLYNDTVAHTKDTSRYGRYHNRKFADACYQHGLICTKTEKLGWSHTEADDNLLEWVYNHDELREIEICWDDMKRASEGMGASVADNGAKSALLTKKNGIRYICPCCHMIVRAARTVNIVCGDCRETMQEK